MINWFPGHMNKTLKVMQADSKLADCFVYVLDSRCPKSSVNPEFVKVVKDKPIIYVLNKADYVEKTKLDEFKSFFTSKNTRCVITNATISGSSKIIISTIKQIFAERLKQNEIKGANFIIRAMVIGVPNSGKSTIVNNLCGSSRAVTGNKAGVTKNKQWIKVDGNIEFMDTPGVLLPNFDDEKVAYNLAFVGSVKDEVLNTTDVACKLIERLNEIDKNILKNKYKVDTENYTNTIEIFNRIGVSRGAIIKGGEIDEERTAKIILTDFRLGKLGKICLE